MRPMSLSKFSFTQKLYSLIVIGSFSLFLGLTITTPANAAPITDFKPGRIIEDSVFTNSTSMNPQQIQSFLNSKVPNCDTNGTQRSELNNNGVPDYNGDGVIQRWEWGRAKYNQTTFPCLKDYTEGGRVAAQIIYDVSQAYNINPQVLIVLLQKEQALVTDTWPSVIQFRSATGYGCPDTAACDSQYYGLTNQLNWAARMFRSILNNSPGWYTPYNLGNNFIRWSPVSSCGGSTVYIENRSTQALYNYTPYQPNASALAAGYGTGDGCGAYGNRNFFLYFRDWFGNNSGPAAFTVSGSSTIYVPVEGYKLAVPYMAALHDYGISADSIQAVPQSYVDSRPTPPANTRISAQISHVVKSPDDSDEDGGSIYLISRGQRYQFKSMAQFFSYGFKESDISYLPLGYIFSLKSAGSTSDFISSPYGSLFKISSNKKSIFFEYQTYINQNPSDSTTALSYYLADKIPSGNPVTDKPVLIQQPTGGSVSLYQNNTYYSIPDYDVLSCWSLNSSAIGVPTYRIAQADYIEPIAPNTTLSCLVNDGTSNILMAGSKRLTVPSNTAISTQSLPADLRQLASKIPLRSNQISPYIKTPDSSAVWYFNANSRWVIPSYRAFTMMGLSDPNVDTVPTTFFNQLSDQGIKLAEGQLVKSTESAAVFVIAGGQRVVYDSSSVFEAFSNKWADIETFSAQELTKNYPFNSARVSNLVVDKLKNKAYIVNVGSCYAVSSATLQAMGKSIESLSTSQSYDISAFKSVNFATCSKPSSLFVKDDSQSLVYWLNNGQRHPLTTYQAMLNKNNGSSPQVMTIDSNLLSSIPTGASISN